MKENILKISYKTFVDFYKDLLTSSARDRPWFFNEKKYAFIIIIPENPLILYFEITKDEIFELSPNKEKLTYEEIIQNWKEENLVNAIPFEGDLL